MTFEEGSGSLRESADATAQLMAPMMRAMAPALSIAAPPRLPSKLRRDHEDCDAGDSGKEGESQANCEALRAENENLRQRHETGNGGENNRGDAGGNALLGPEEEAVVDDEDEKRKQECGKPLAGRRPALAVRDCPEKNQQARGQKSHGAEEERWELADADANGEEGRSPNKIDNRKGQEDLPASGFYGGFHISSYKNEP